jgi:hypothetical protein
VLALAVAPAPPPAPVVALLLDVVPVVDVVPVPVALPLDGERAPGVPPDGAPPLPVGGLLCELHASGPATGAASATRRALRKTRWSLFSSRRSRLLMWTSDDLSARPRSGVEPGVYRPGDRRSSAGTCAAIRFVARAAPMGSGPTMRGRQRNGSFRSRAASREGVGRGGEVGTGGSRGGGGVERTSGVDVRVAAVGARVVAVAALVLMLVLAGGWAVSGRGTGLAPGDASGAPSTAFG